MTDTTTMPDTVRAAAPADEHTIAAPTRFIQTTLETYAYRRFGGGGAPPLVCLQHFTGTLDNWDPAVTDALAGGREIILFESAGLGRSSGDVPTTVAGMAAHFLAFADALGLEQVDLLGFSLGGMVAQVVGARTARSHPEDAAGRDGAGGGRGHHAPGEAGARQDPR